MHAELDVNVVKPQVKTEEKPEVDEKVEVKEEKKEVNEYEGFSDFEVEGVKRHNVLRKKHRAPPLKLSRKVGHICRHNKVKISCN